jgi:hypothetical protein
MQKPLRWQVPDFEFRRQDRSSVCSRVLHVGQRCELRICGCQVRLVRYALHLHGLRKDLNFSQSFFDVMDRQRRWR